MSIVKFIVYNDSMFKLWIKTYSEHKLKINYLYTGEGAFDPDRLFDYMSEICGSLDLPTPMVLESHIKKIDNFNITRFRRTDFVESVSFDMLTAEYVPDEPDQTRSALE